MCTVDAGVGPSVPVAVTYLIRIITYPVRCVYESWAAASFMSYWLQRISAAIVGGDARRAFTAISKRAGLLT